MREENYIFYWTREGKSRGVKCHVPSQEERDRIVANYHCATLLPCDGVRYNSKPRYLKYED